jgi:hypothetical protein
VRTTSTTAPAASKLFARCPVIWSALQPRRLLRVAAPHAGLFIPPRRADRHAKVTRCRHPTLSAFRKFPT